MGVTPTAGGVGVASTSYIKNIIATLVRNLQISLFNQSNLLMRWIWCHSKQIPKADLAPNETTFFESTYPIVMTDRDSLQ